eukprot:12007202-Alexandrium_andersonii.AAC.1
MGARGPGRARSRHLRRRTTGRAPPRRSAWPPHRSAPDAAVSCRRSVAAACLLVATIAAFDAACPLAVGNSGALGSVETEPGNHFDLRRHRTRGPRRRAHARGAARQTRRKRKCDLARRRGPRGRFWRWGSP